MRVVVLVLRFDCMCVALLQSGDLVKLFVSYDLWVMISECIK